MFEAVVLFYKLDIKYAETANLCLLNLLTSLILKNPLYTKIHNLILTAHVDTLDTLENKMGDISS